MPPATLLGLNASDGRDQIWSTVHFTFEDLYIINN